MDNLFQNYYISSSNPELNKLQQDILRIRTIQEPLQLKLKNSFLEFESFDEVTESQKRKEFQISAISELSIVGDSIKDEMSKFIMENDNPLIISLALIFSNFENHPEKLSKHMLTYVEEKFINNSMLPLTKSILNKLYSKNIEYYTLGQMEFKSINGDILDIFSLDSRYVLLDFWASWCTPCRHSIKTTLRELSLSFNSDVLKIVGVSIDKSRDDALRAIKLDKSEFLQIYHGEEGALVKLFDVSSIPYYVLVDKKLKKINHLSTSELVYKIIEERK